MSPLPPSFLPINTPVPTSCILAKVTALSAIRAIFTVPVKLPADKLVKFAPLTAGNVVGNLPLAIVPVKFAAGNDDKSTTKSIVPSPSSYVAVIFVSVLLLNIAPTIS